LQSFNACTEKSTSAPLARAGCGYQFLIVFALKLFLGVVFVLSFAPLAELA